MVAAGSPAVECRVMLRWILSGHFLANNVRSSVPMCSLAYVSLLVAATFFPAFPHRQCVSH